MSRTRLGRAGGPVFAPQVAQLARPSGLSRAIVASLALLCWGCGPTLYTTSASSASRLLKQARDENARWYAPYEYYFAEANLQQARQEAASAEYEDAIRHVHIAEEFSARAIAITKQKRQAER